MTENLNADISDDELERSIEFLSDVDGDVADRFGSEIEDRTEAAQRVVEARTLVENAQEVGLADDPAVEALERRAAILAKEHDLVESAPPETPAHRFADEYGAKAGALEEMHDDDVEAVLQHLEMAEQIDDADDNALAEKELERRADEVCDLLKRNGLGPEDVFGAPEIPDRNRSTTATLAAPGEVEDTDPSGELSAALADGAISDASTALSASSERVKLARIDDELEELDEKLAAATHPFLKHKLERERAELRDLRREVEDGGDAA